MMSTNNIPSFLSHYSEAVQGPFRNRSHLPLNFPAMRHQDGSPYRGRVFTLDEVPASVKRFG